MLGDRIQMMFIINILIKVVIPFGLFIWSIFMPVVGGYTFVGLYLAFQAYLLLIDSSKPNPDPSKWDTDEIEIIRKYHLALRFPFGANTMSTQLNGIRWTGLFIFTPWFLWNQMWIAAAVAAISFFVTASIAVRLDPFFFLGDAVNSGKMQFASELYLLKDVSERLKGQK
jgi:hypothetical protein